MKKIFFYIDSFGLGHITRQIALIRAIGNNANISVFAREHLDILRMSLPGIDVKMTEIGPKLVAKGLGLDVEKTKEINHNFEEDFQKGVDIEIIRMKKEQPDLIVADIPAEVFVAANERSIPIAAVSNFGWTIIFEHIFGKESSEYKHYADAYSKSSKTFVLPFNEPMEPFSNKKRVGLLRRRLTRNLEKRYGILTSFGRSVTEKLNIQGSFYTFPNDDMESQDHVAAAQAVFTKPGYGTVSEAVSAGVPIFLRRRNNFPESEYIIKSLDAVKVVPDDVDADKWINKEMENINWNGVKKMKERYKDNSDFGIGNELISYI